MRDGTPLGRVLLLDEEREGSEDEGRAGRVNRVTHPVIPEPCPAAEVFVGAS
jgi:hypothetical protein